MARKSLKNRPDAANFILDDYPLYNLNRSAATYTTRMSEALKSIDIDQPRWRILMLLGDQNPSTVSELARRSVTKLSTITRIVIRMEENGYVTRSVCEKDNRVTQVNMTNEGDRILNLLHDIASNIYECAFAGIGNKEIDQFLNTLKKIRANLTDTPHKN